MSADSTRVDTSSLPASHAPGGEWQAACWSMVAAFGTYFCMYAFRKPITVATFEDLTWWGVRFKAVAVAVQVLGYMVSKFVGIKLIAEMPPTRRASAILVLAAIAGLTWVGFGACPVPWNVVFLFFNGLVLGMVFGLVLGYLEGRRTTELLTAGLCASFIVADGAVKAVGAWILQRGVGEFWMPLLVALLFTLPLLVFVMMLSQIRPPDPLDEQLRSLRVPMTPQDRSTFLRRYAVVMGCLVVLHLGITILRTLRSDFLPELWRGLGEVPRPKQFATSELVVGFTAVFIASLGFLIRNNLAAFLAAIGVSLLGVVFVLVAWPLREIEVLSPFGVLVLVGIGLYLPYVAVHTTLFERLIAMTRDRANVGFVLYVADAIGYLGYVVILLGREFLTVQSDMLPFFRTTSIVISLMAFVCLVVCGLVAIRRWSGVPALAAGSTEPPGPCEAEGAPYP